jgi:[protein-PII] uridylyltransferase
LTLPPNATPFRHPIRMLNYLHTLEIHAREALKPAREGQLSPAERIALYKQFLKIEEKRILQHHRAGAGGLEIARDRAALIDTLLSAILHESSKESAAQPIALVATGGYGRGLLNPRSDIDLLFLLPRASNKLPKPLQELVQDVLYLLWDVGFKVGHACRSIAECIQQARLDQENKTALMDSRLISGDAALFENFRTKFTANASTRASRRSSTSGGRTSAHGTRNTRTPCFSRSPT